MSVYQVEQYYVFIVFEELIGEDLKSEISKMIIDEGYDFFNMDKLSVTVDGFESESDAKELKSKIMALLP